MLCLTFPNNFNVWSHFLCYLNCFILLGQFSTSYKITIGADFALKTIEWDEDVRINLHLWDIAGHERFGSLTGVFYRHA